MALEDGLEPLGELEWVLGGLPLPIARDGGDQGLDDVGDVEGDATDSGFEGAVTGRLRKPPRPVELRTTISPAGSEDSEEIHAEYAQALNELRRVVDLLPDRRTGVRLLRWRRRGELAKRAWVEPAVGKPLVVPGDEARLLHGRSANLAVRLSIPDGTIWSDEFHEFEFTTPGQEATITNAGSFTALLPCAWWLEADDPVTITNVDFGESVTFPVGPVTVSQHREIVAPGAYNICFGPGGVLAPRWPLLRPGDNTIRASAPCTFYWRDSF